MKKEALHITFYGDHRPGKNEPFDRKFSQYTFCEKNPAGTYIVFIFKDIVFNFEGLFFNLFIENFKYINFINILIFFFPKFF